MSIGEVLAQLRPEFPDITISKIRFLEDQGLVEPDRAPSGYRRFTYTDVERLRFVLAVQRDHYLPLRVIREHLDALDRGVDRPLPGGSAAPARGPRLVSDAAPDDPDHFGSSRSLRMTRAEILAAAACEEALLGALEAHGLVAPDGAGCFDGEALVVVRTARQLASYGIEPRHLRPFRTAADREAGLVQQVVAPIRRQGGHRTDSGEPAAEAEREVAALAVRLHAALLRSALMRGGPGS